MPIINGEYCHTIEDIKNIGWKDTGVRLKDMPSYTYLSRKAMAEDITIESLNSFRLAPGEWGIFIKINPVKGYISHPLLP